MAFGDHTIPLSSSKTHDSCFCRGSLSQLSLRPAAILSPFAPPCLASEPDTQSGSRDGGFLGNARSCSIGCSVEPHITAWQVSGQLWSLLDLMGQIFDVKLQTLILQPRCREDHQSKSLVSADHDEAFASSAREPA